MKCDVIAGGIVNAAKHVSLALDLTQDFINWYVDFRNETFNLRHPRKGKWET